MSPFGPLSAVCSAFSIVFVVIARSFGPKNWSPPRFPEADLR